MTSVPFQLREAALMQGFRVVHRPIRARGRLHHSRSPWLLYQMQPGYEPSVYHAAFVTADKALRYLKRRQG